jgi:hypothetical protein
MGFDSRWFGVAARVAAALMTSACLQILRCKQQWVKGWKKLHSNDTIRTDQHQRSSVARLVDTRCRHGSAQVLRQSFQCLQGTANADEAVVKCAQISTQDLRRVSLGIERHEQHLGSLDRFGPSNALVHCHQRGKRLGARLPTMGIAKQYKGPLSLQPFLCKRVPVLIDQRERIDRPTLGGKVHTLRFTVMGQGRQDWTRGKKPQIDRKIQLPSHFLSRIDMSRACFGSNTAVCLD